MEQRGAVTALFLQARLNSSRLPRKALLPLAGTPVVVHAMRALKELDVDSFWLVTDRSSEPELAPWAEAEGFRCFAGPEEDVLERFLLAADYAGIDTVLRATGDNPLVSRELAGLSLQRHRSEQNDYTAYTGAPLGTGVEVLAVPALRRAYAESTCPYDHEHVAPYLYKNPDRFKVVQPGAPARWRMEEARVTLDTREDYRRLETIFAEIYRGEPVALEGLVRYLKEQALAERRGHAG